MKTLATILRQKPVFLNEWNKHTEEQIFAEFECYEANKDKNALAEKHKGERILFASYTYEGYEGSAWVLFTKGGKLYEVSGSHCSCYGLEGQWEPQETSLKALEMRVRGKDWGTSRYDGSGFSKEFIEFLGVKFLKV